jgi:hypothetical protein
MTFSQKTPLSEAVKHENRKIDGFIASKGFMAPETAQICQELQAGMIL